MLPVKIVINSKLLHMFSVQFLNRVRLCDPMDCLMPGFLVHHQLLELAQTPVHRVLDAIQPSHPLIRFLCLSIPYSPLQVGGSGYLPEAGHYVWLQ